MNTSQSNHTYTNGDGEEVTLKALEECIDDVCLRTNALKEIATYRAQSRSL